MNLASVQKIISVIKHPNADSLSIVTLLGWSCITKLDQFKENDLVGYIMIDTICPPTEEFEFLAKYNYRVKTQRLRGELSQGLVIPLPEGNWKEGDDLTDIIGVVKYEKPDNNPIRESIPKRPKTFWARLKCDFKYHFLYKWFPKLRPKTRSPFPKHLVPITDEERIQNIPKVLEQYKGKDFIASYKLDGSSITIIHEKNFLGKPVYRICSRRFELHDKNNEWYKVFNDTNFKQHIDKLVWLFGDNVIVQGEAIGTFNGNHHNLKSNEIRLFNIYVDGKRMDQKTFIDVCETHNIPHCPWHWVGQLNFTLPDILQFAQIKDTINPKVEAEGLVFRCVEDNLSFKVINNRYLLSEK